MGQKCYYFVVNNTQYLKDFLTLLLSRDMQEIGSSNFQASNFMSRAPSSPFYFGRMKLIAQECPGYNHYVFFKTIKQCFMTTITKLSLSLTI
jgi:hypothetical protein